jgi:hypothetical protein
MGIVFVFVQIRGKLTHVFIHLGFFLEADDSSDSNPEFENVFFNWSLPTNEQPGLNALIIFLNL